MAEPRKLVTLVQIREAMRRVRHWQQQPDGTVLCPLCDAPGLTVIDRSARPSTEWFVVTCPACGLDDTLQIPLAPPAAW